MGIFNKLFKAKENATDKKLNVVPAVHSGYLGEAEYMANVVTAGIAQGNYSEMNKQLVPFSPNAGKDEVFVFEHPSTGANLTEVLICSVFSLLFLFYAFVGGGTIFLSSEYSAYGVIWLGISLVLLIVNVKLLFGLVSAIKFKNRFDEYEDLLRYKSFEIIQTLALSSKQPNTVVVDDLKKSVEQKLIPQGHFSRENVLFMVTDDAYDRYVQNQAEYERYFTKLAEERKRVKERTEEMTLIMDTGTRYIERIHDYSKIIKDKYVIEDLEEMESIVSTIFHEVDINQSRASSLGMFLNYYFPTTEKLLDTYISICERKDSSKQLAKAKAEIEKSIATIVDAYENILKKLYKEYELDILSEISTSDVAMSQAGVISGNNSQDKFQNLAVPKELAQQNEPSTEGASPAVVTEAIASEEASPICSISEAEIKPKIHPFEIVQKAISKKSTPWRKKAENIPLHSPFKSAKKPSQTQTVNYNGRIIQTGDPILHQQWGTGYVVGVEKNRIIIKFEEGEKKFIFPNALEKGFLKIPR